MKKLNECLVVTLFSQKGGTTKTTTAMNLAGTLGRRGYATKVVDLDMQGSATDWWNACEDKSLKIDLAQHGRTKTRISDAIAAESKNYDFVVVDCPPASEAPSVSQTLLVSDLCIIPTRNSPNDIRTLGETLELVNRARDLNQDLAARLLVADVERDKALAKNYAAFLAKISEQEDIQVLKSQTSHLQAYVYASLHGTTVHHVPNAKRAVQEIEALTDEVLSILQIGGC